MKREEAGDLLEAARGLHRAGDLAGAIAAYEAVLLRETGLAPAWHMKAIAEHQARRLDGALRSIARAIELAGEQPPYLLVQGSVLHDLGRLDAAEQVLARAAAAKPGWAACLVELGRVRLDQRRFEEAAKDFQAAVAADSRHVGAWNNLGFALQSLDRLDEAVRAFDYALSIDPGYARAHFNVARIHKLRGNAKLALQHAQSAVRFDPSYAEAWLLVGDLHSQKRETANALAAYSAAARAAPGDVKIRIALADAVAGSGGYREAREEYRRIWTQFPASLRAALPANLLLPQIHASVEALERTRAEFSAGLDRLREASPGLRFAGPEAALADARWTNFYLAYQGRDDVDLQRRYGEFLRGVLAGAVPEFYAPRPRRRGAGRIRVGFLSHFFFNCTAGRYFASWITALDRERFETFVYYTNEWIADDTRAIAAAAAKFRHLPGRPGYVLAQCVAGDDLDVLVYPELGMHPETFTLASLRLAPVQCAGWGHPDTTGHPEIDWFISCEEMEPPDAQRHYSERLALLPGLGTRYAVPRTESTRTRADFGLPEDRTLYLLPQSLFKIHPDNDEIVARVLERDPRGVAVLFASHHENVTQAFAERLAAAFERRGLDFHERACFLAPFMPHGEYLRLNQVCDLMLDTVHWSGGNTSLDALASGLPVVTLPGSLMRGRQSRAMLRVLGVEDALVAKDVDHYVAIAE
ncbi:MAG TPA: tetratricopeptide repeat protein, partial [Usitatibacter sp.]|nr:tetratricopeptide repeat protein [Usitatibacter sp.]